MKATVLEDNDSRRVALITFTAVASVLLHVGAAWAISRIEIPTESAPIWVQAILQEVQPPPEPEPPPPPEPEPEPEPEPRPLKKAPVPEIVPYQETAKDPTPAAEPRPIRKINFGVTATSTGKGAGWSVEQGNTVATKQRNDGAPEDTAFITVPYTSVTAAPRIKGGAPRLTVPQEIIDAEIEGRVEVELTIGVEGEVRSVTVVSGLHPAADAACLADLRKTRWTAGSRDGVAVVVEGVPFSCRYEMAVE